MTLLYTTPQPAITQTADKELLQDALEALEAHDGEEFNASATVMARLRAALRTELSSVVQGEPVAVAVVAHGRLGNRLMWGTEDAQANTPVGAQLYTTPQPAIDTDRLREIIACAYQIAGAYDAPAHVLDVLANPLEATQAQIDALLPFVPDRKIIASGQGDTPDEAASAAIASQKGAE